MKNFILTIFLAAIFLPATAFAQIASNQPIYQSGTVTPGHLGMFATSGVLMDAGAAGGGAPGTNPNSLNITGPNDPFCINDAPTTSLTGYHQTCIGFGANPANQFEFSMNSYAGAPNLPCVFIVNGTIFPCIGNVSGTPFVASEAALAAEPSTFSAAVIRLDYAPGINAPPLLYTSSSSPCSLNGGLGDGGSQVPSSDSKCWIAQFNGWATISEWGGQGNGTTNDAVADQAAFNWAASVHGTLQLPPNWLSYIGSATLNDAGQGIIIHGNNPTSGHTTDTCTSGFTNVLSGTPSNTSLLLLTGSGTKMDHVCVQAGPGSNVAAAMGAAITIGGGQNQQLIDNIIQWPYDGIVGDNANPTNTLVLEHNWVIGPANRGVAIGQTRAGTGVNGFRFVDNTIVCNSATPANFGLIIYGAGIDHYAGNDILNCNVNVAIEPGKVGGSPQFVLGFLSDVIGDTAVVNSLLIQPQGGTVEYLTFGRGWWVGMNNNETGDGIVIDQATGGGTIRNVSFVGGIVHGANTVNPQNLFNVEGTICGLVINDNMIAADGAGTNNTGIYENQSGCPAGVTINSNSFVQLTGQLLVALNIPSTAASGVTFIGNNLYAPATPIIFSPTAVNWVFNNESNYPDATNTAVVASAASITVPAYFDQADITGTTTIMNMSPWWQLRHIRLRTSGIVTFALGGGTGGFCTAVTSSASEIINAYWNPNSACWDLK